MVRLSKEHVVDYFAARNEVASSPEEILIAIEDMQELRLETAYFVEESIELLASPPSTWPSLA